MTAASAVDMTAFDAACEDLLADPLKYKAKWLAEARVSHPQMTEEQHEADWRYVSKLMGLE